MRPEPGSDCSCRALYAASMPRCVIFGEALRRPALCLFQPRFQPVGDPGPAMDGRRASRDKRDVAARELDVGLVLAARVVDESADAARSEEHTSELQSL